jgi:hypothetical protein
MKGQLAFNPYYHEMPNSELQGDVVDLLTKQEGSDWEDLLGQALKYKKSAPDKKLIFQDRLPRLPTLLFP